MPTPKSSKRTENAKQKNAGNIDIAQPEYYLNRQLSQLEFNARVLAQATDARVPLLERLRYLCITSANLDEFFERVSGAIES